MTTERRLTSQRLVLRPWKDTDRQPFAELSADPAVMEHLMPIPTREAADAWIDRQRQHLAEHGFCFWAVELTGSVEFIGAVGLFRIGYQAHFTPAVEVGWRLARQFWGQGYAPEAAEAALHFGFDDLGLNEIVANTAPANANSQRVMMKLGMSRDPADDFDHPLAPEGHKPRRQVLYRLARNDWAGFRDSRQVSAPSPEAARTSKPGNGQEQR
jgi:ribosomal-protein-alanine N-acetyltransferase